MTKNEDKIKLRFKRHNNSIDSFFPFSPVETIYQTWKRHQLHNEIHQNMKKKIGVFSSDMMKSI
jgi:hypothetical protein